MPRVSKIPAAPPVNTYGLERLGYTDLGLTGDRDTDQIRIEMICFQIGLTPREGGLGKFEHFKNVVDLCWNNPRRPTPKRFVWCRENEKILRECCKRDELGVAGPSSLGKCWSPNTPILKHDGNKIMAWQVKPGDLLMGDDSTPREVQEVHRGRGEMYRITPVKGDPWECNGDHILVLKRAFAGRKSRSRVGEIVEISVKDYLKKSDSFKKAHKQFCVGVEFPEKEVPIDPRLFGIWLGDGHVHNCRISIPAIDKEILSYVEEWSERNGYVMVHHDYDNQTCPSYQIKPKVGPKHNKLWRFFKSKYQDGEKRIGRDYLVNSREVRMQVLAGLLDTDGYAGGPKGTGFEIATKYEGLKEDIVFLARSLGFRVRYEFRMAKCGGKEFPSWRIYIMGDADEIPTFRKKCQKKVRRMNSDCTGFKVEEIGVGNWVGFSVDGNHRLLLGDFTVNHNSDPIAMWCVVNYISNPTHTKVLIMSTTIQGAKDKIWKTFKEYIETLPNYPGKPLWGTNQIQGPNYTETGYGNSSGVYLLAGEKGREKDALDNLIGIKAPATGDPDVSFEALRERPEFAGLDKQFGEVELESLLPRLLNLCAERPGKIILAIDEATGIVESVLNAIMTNIKPGNPGKLQTIMIANPNLHYDVFGLFCEPAVGWDKVTLNDYEWGTRHGGWCIRFNAEESSLIRDKNKACSWMQTQKTLDELAVKFGGKKSLYYYRFVLGFWCPEGADSGIYSQGDAELGMSKATWLDKRPKLHSSLDPAWAAGGDKPSCTFFKYGIDVTGKRAMEVIEQVPIEIDAGNKEVPIPYQVARGWKRECIKRKVPPERAAFDSTGGGLVFAGIIHMEWSAKVQAISSSGKASARPVGKEKDGQGKTVIIKANERFANKATEICYGAHPFLRAGQIYGITPTLAKEMCSIRHADKKGGGTGRTVQKEDKKTYKKREGSSPDDADSFFVGLEHLRTKYGFKPVERAGDETPTADDSQVPNSAWEQLKKRARRIKVKGNLPRG